MWPNDERFCELRVRQKARKTIVHRANIKKSFHSFLMTWLLSITKDNKKRHWKMEKLRKVSVWVSENEKILFTHQDKFVLNSLGRLDNTIFYSLLNNQISLRKCPKMLSYAISNKVIKVSSVTQSYFQTTC